jgi:predicted nucleic acid-binding protein
VQATFDAIGVDAAAARSYGQVVAAVVAIGRSHRRRSGDLLIAATAHANGLPLSTRNPDDLDALEGLIEIIGVCGGAGRRSRP